jgi:hypothetical protein
VKPWIAKQLYWASLFMDNHDPPMGGYYERLIRRVGEQEARTVHENNSGFALAMFLLLARWIIIPGIIVFLVMWR